MVLISSYFVPRLSADKRSVRITEHQTILREILAFVVLQPELGRLAFYVRRAPGAVVVNHQYYDEFLSDELPLEEVEEIFERFCDEWAQ